MKLFHQLNDYFCGPAVVATLLAAQGVQASQEEIGKLAGTNDKVGTSTAGLVLALQHFGAQVEAGDDHTLDDVRQALGEGKGVVVCYTEPHLEWGHLSIVAGFKDDNILLLSPDEEGPGPTPMKLDEFEARWQDPLFTKSDHWAAFVTFPKV